MLRDEIRSIDSGPRALRSFGLLFGAVLGCAAGWLWWAGRPGWPWAAAAAGLMAAAGLLLPRLLWPLHRAWMAFGLLLGRLMSVVVLTALFFGLLTPLRLAARLAGRHFLPLGPDRSLPSYWTRREPGADDPDRSERQF